MIDWLVKNPQIIIFIVFGVVAIVGNIAKAKQEAEKKRLREQHRANNPAQTQPHPARTFDTSAMDTEEAERTRRLQEELRRKILARMQGAQPPANTPMPRPVMQQVKRNNERHPALTPPPLPAARAQADAPTPFDESNSAYLSATEKLAELEAIARSAPANKDEAFALPDEGAAAPHAATGIQATLRDSHELRRAFVLREILDAPVSLR